MPIPPGLTEEIAANLITSLLEALAGAVRKRLSQSEAKKALKAAIASALAEALEGQELEDRDQEWDHYDSVLKIFFASEEVTFQLVQLLDPRPDQVPDLSTLAHEFRMAGYVPETMPGFELEAFLRAFFSAFYAAAGMQEPLQDGINLKLLGTQLQQLGVVVSELGRVADASESSAATLQRIDKKIEVLVERFVTGTSEEEDLRRNVEAARAEGFLAAYRMFEGIGSGLLRLGLGLGVDARGVLEIVPSGSETFRALPPARLEAVRLLAGDLYNDVAAHPPTEAELNALEARYRQHIIRWFESLTFRGMMRAPKSTPGDPKPRPSASASTGPKPTACRSSSHWPPSTTCCARASAKAARSRSASSCRATTTAAAASPAWSPSSAAPSIRVARSSCSTVWTRCSTWEPAPTSRNRPAP